MPAGIFTPMSDRKMTAEEYHRRFADQIIEQIKQGTAPWQKPWKPFHGPDSSTHVQHSMLSSFI